MRLIESECGWFYNLDKMQQFCYDFEPIDNWEEEKLVMECRIRMWFEEIESFVLIHEFRCKNNEECETGYIDFFNELINLMCSNDVNVIDRNTINKCLNKYFE